MFRRKGTPPAEPMPDHRIERMIDRRKIIYVDKAFGNDHGSGTFQNPLKTVEEAEKRINAEDCICVIPKDRRL